jgi:hypothetical protein
MDVAMTAQARGSLRESLSTGSTVYAARIRRYRIWMATGAIDGFQLRRMGNLGDVGVADAAFKRRMNRLRKAFVIDEEGDFFSLPLLFQSLHPMAGETDIFRIGLAVREIDLEKRRSEQQKAKEEDHACFDARSSFYYRLIGFSCLTFSSAKLGRRTRLAKRLKSQPPPVCTLRTWPVGEIL